MARRRFSNLLALAVLSCLNERPMHPYEISQTLRQRGKDQSIKLNYGALYGVVESLTKAGLIEPRETVREGKRPERTVYAITEAGAQEHDEWLEDLIATPVRDYHSLEAGLALMAGLAPDQVVRALEERTVKLRVELGQRRRVAPDRRGDAAPRDLQHRGRPPPGPAAGGARLRHRAGRADADRHASRASRAGVACTSSWPRA